MVTARLIGLAALVCGFFLCGSAQGQTSPLIIDRSRPDRVPAATATEAPTPPAAAGSVRADVGGFRPFVFTHLEVQGSSLPAEQLGKAAEPFVGKTLGREDLAKLANAVGAIYATSDVALYSVLLPSQAFDSGIVRIRILEGYVADIEVVAQPGRPAPRLTRAYAAALKHKKPLRRPELERELGLMRDIPGATPDIQILQTGQPGAVRLAVTPKTQRFELASSLNNRGSAMLGRTQIEVDAKLNDLMREGDQTTLTVAVPTEIKRFQYVGVSHREPIGEAGTAVTVNAGYLRTKPKISGFDLEGTATTAGATVVHPLIRSNLKNLYLTGGVDGLNSDNALFGRTLSQEHTRAFRVAAAYTVQSAKTATSVSATASQGLDILGARTANPALADAEFTKLNGQLAHAVYSERFALRVAATAQVTGDRLPASEKFSVGGAQFGRAFAAAVITGDSGYAASIELALRRNAPKSFAGSEAYVFADYGRVTNRGGLLRDDSVASAGGGVRLALNKKAVVELEVAKAIDDVAGRSGTRPARLMINIRTLF